MKIENLKRAKELSNELLDQTVTQNSLERNPEVTEIYINITINRNQSVGMLIDDPETASRIVYAIHDYNQRLLSEIRKEIESL